MSKSSPSRVAEQREDGQRSALIRAALILCPLRPQRRVGVSLNASTFNRSAWFQSTCRHRRTRGALQGAAQTVLMMIDPAGPDLGPVQKRIQSSHVRLNVHMCIGGTTTGQKKHGNNATNLLVVHGRGAIGSFN